jgi:hypothetical protein
MRPAFLEPVDSTKMTQPSLDLERYPERLRHVRWIGGGSGAGKSTIAGLLAAEYGLRLYHCDDTQSAHTARSNPASDPLLHAFMKMSMDERWMKRTPEEMFQTFHGFHGEGFRFILEDLLDLPNDRPILVEGYKLLPRLVFPLLSQVNQAAWLIPTPEWRRAAFAKRGSLGSIAGRTSDPEKALANLLARDALYTEEVARQAKALQLTTIKIDGSLTVAEVAQRAAYELGFRK